MVRTKNTHENIKAIVKTPNPPIIDNKIPIMQYIFFSFFTRPIIAKVIPIIADIPAEIIETIPKAIDAIPK